MVQLKQSRERYYEHVCMNKTAATKSRLFLPCIKLLVFMQFLYNCFEELHDYV